MIDAATTSDLMPGRRRGPVSGRNARSAAYAREQASSATTNHITENSVTARYSRKGSSSSHWLPK